MYVAKFVPGDTINPPDNIVALTLYGIFDEMPAPRLGVYYKEMTEDQYNQDLVMGKIYGYSFDNDAVEQITGAVASFIETKLPLVVTYLQQSNATANLTTAILANGNSYVISNPVILHDAVLEALENVSTDGWTIDFPTGEPINSPVAAIAHTAAQILEIHAAYSSLVVSNYAHYQTLYAQAQSYLGSDVATDGMALAAIAW